MSTNGMKKSQKTLEKSGSFDIFIFCIIADQQARIETLSQEVNILTRQVEWFKQQFKLASQRQCDQTHHLTVLSIRQRKIVTAAHVMQSHY